MPQPNRIETIIFIFFLAWVFLLGPIIMYLAEEQLFQLTKLMYLAGAVILFVIGIGLYITRIIREHGVSTLIFTLFWIVVAVLLSILLRSLLLGS